jgi:hypothetical protein
MVEEAIDSYLFGMDLLLRIISMTAFPSDFGIKKYPLE